MAKVFIPRERRPGETRVAATPETVKRMVKQGLEVAVEGGAGLASLFSDAEFAAAGARLVGDPAAAWESADVVLKVTPPGRFEGLTRHEAEGLKPGAVLIGFLAPYRNLDMVRTLAAGGVTSLALELVPRVTRAQPMDALSSQASIAGYKAVLLAAWRLPKYLPLLMTAAGTIKPARVVVMGAGVAGLQAIATAKRLGAVVEVSDIRAAVKEQVESLGGKFIELPQAESGEGQGGYAREMGEDFLRRQREIVQRHLAAADAVITTALVPGRPAPRLVTAEMVRAMRPGSVIVDLAVEQGGNCELSQADSEVVENGVVILGPSNLPAAMPHDASLLYARNVHSLLQLVVDKEGKVAPSLDDEIIAGSLLTHGGRVLHQPTAAQLQPQEVPA
ncbi:MAG TPA: Re/Si-specific NAD(P)(+) transhydrogenase subunit alpha [Thermoanaerobaculia bacterium]|jgi:NAD(P) transhydrogenase subunit alpha|nr:Re/Si-specific NAD(P)(+) transhydrogenase subunit alpha [Thermoanaerobaculia bacterium]